MDMHSNSAKGSFWQQIRPALNMVVIVAGLGYFVDLFHITLFGVVRVSSFNSLGITDPDLAMKAGVLAYNAQMIGMMIGGLFWGILGDKIGRYVILTVPIVMYSVGSIANVFVWDAESYAICRFITGVGLAGELGAAITLVSETLPKEIRGVGTTIVATLGLLGSVFAGFFGQLMDWKSAYVSAGIVGFALLAVRLKVLDRNVVDKNKNAHAKVDRGNFMLLLTKGRGLRYLKCILIGIPIYYITGVMFTFAPELTKSMNIQGTVTAGNTLLWGTIGLTTGDFISGMLSQVLKSRNKAVAICLGCALVGCLIYLNLTGVTPFWINLMCFLIGSAAGYWAVLVTLAAEQFGTNIRATVATTVPNFVRGAAALVVSLFAYLKPSLGVVQSATAVGGVLFALALVSLFTLEETFGKDLNFTEEK
ncbi:MAG: MFS transporter [Bdellovibrionaceae bacterium]|nr:MFS transporter [Pseudobdellovibrionaceae bacterium]